MEMLPQAPAAGLSGAQPKGAFLHHCSGGPEVGHDTAVEAPPMATAEHEVLNGSTQEGRRVEGPGSPPPSTQATQDITTTLGLEDAPSSVHPKKAATLTCQHPNFPLRACVTRASHLRPAHGRLGRRPGRRSQCGPSIAALRDAGLEVFDENEESDFQESETETETPQADTTDAEFDCTAGLESDVEGAVGGEAPEVMAPPGTPGGRRASIVTVDTRREEILASPEPVKVAVFGTDGVGKSALIVRLLTGRFIGEYDPTLEAVYSYQIPLPGHTLPLQVMDTAGHVEVVEAGRERQVWWGEGFMLVFSLTSHASFTALTHLRRVILELTPGSPRPMVLVGNKADLAHAREVQDQEIRALANTWGCDYFEVAAPEPWQVVVRPFAAIYQAVLSNRAAH